MRRRLFFKIYLTMLGGILALALAAGALAVLKGRHEEHGWFDQRAELIAAALPPARDPQTLQAALDRIGALSGAELTLRDARGEIVARHASHEAREGWRFAAASVPTPEGGKLDLRFASPFQDHDGPPFIPLLLIAGLTALAAWPTARRLTRRLERLRQGVESWGEGDLARRVPVEGGDEIAAVAASFNRAAERVEALVESQRRLLANASHELRSPLARLRMGVDLYERKPTEARRVEILRNLSELDELVGEILLSSRLSHEAPIADFESLDLLSLAAEEAARADLEVSGAPVEVMGDARLLARLIGNLIQNALRHGEPPIEITVSRAGERAELTLRDHGPGLPSGEGERLFEPFHRPGGYGEAAGGWGLGLALVRQIAERHGGSVRYEAPVEGGARFIVSLPAA